MSVKELVSIIEDRILSPSSSLDDHKNTIADVKLFLEQESDEEKRKSIIDKTILKYPGLEEEIKKLAEITKAKSESKAVSEDEDVQVQVEALTESSGKPDAEVTAEHTIRKVILQLDF